MSIISFEALEESLEKEPDLRKWCGYGLVFIHFIGYMYDSEPQVAVGAQWWHLICSWLPAPSSVTEQQCRVPTNLESQAGAQICLCLNG